MIKKLIIRHLFCLSVTLVSFSSISQDFQKDTIFFNRYDVNFFHQMIGKDLFLSFYKTDDLPIDFPKNIHSNNYDSCYVSIIDSTFEGLGSLIDTLFLYQCFKGKQRDFYYYFNEVNNKVSIEEMNNGLILSLNTGQANKNLKIKLSNLSKDKEYSQLSTASDIAFLEPVNRDYFLDIKLYNYWVGDFVVDGDSISMILYDANGNGEYLDSSDIISIDNYGVSGFTLLTNYINTEFVKKTHYFGIKDNSYKILEINEKSGYLVFQKTNTQPDIAIKPNVSDLLIRNEDNKLVTIRELASGQYLCLNFWMRYCTPCIRKFPFINEYTTNTTSNIKVVGVLDDSNIEELLELKEYFKLQFDQTLSSEEIKNTFQVAGFPHVVLIDPEGYIVTTRFNIDSLFVK